MGRCLFSSGNRWGDAMSTPRPYCLGLYDPLDPESSVEILRDELQPSSRAEMQIAIAAYNRAVARHIRATRVLAIFRREEVDAS